MMLNKIYSRALFRCPRNLHRWCTFLPRWKSDLSGGATGKSGETINGVSLPPEPTYCCMSGCANCVWIKYAQELAQMFDDGDMIAKNKIMEKVKDPKLRAYLFTQLGLKEKE